MTDRPTKQEWDAAQLAGENARRATKPMTACPPYGSGEKAATLRDGWVTGWERADGQQRGCGA